MTLTIAQFWKLLLDSQLVTTEQWQQLQLDFARSEQGSITNDPHAVGHWLISNQVLSAYQSTILLNGHSGPFFYGDYRVQDRITQGRFDGYFQAIHRPTGHPVLLQFLIGEQYQDPTSWQEFVSSAHRQSTVTSSTLQAVHEVLDVGDFRLVAYEDLGEGQTAGQLIENAGRLSPEDACRVTWNVIHALYPLQQAGVVFGNICPENIWVAASGHLHLIRDCTQGVESLDFTRLNDDPRLKTMADYLAPELAAGDQGCSVLSDMYALGCCCYELLAGQVPFAGPGTADKIQQHAQQPIQPLEPVGVPQPLAQLITYLMAKNPQLRYQDWGDLLQKFATLVSPADQTIPASQPQSTLAAYLAVVQQRKTRVAEKAAANAMAAATVSPTGANDFPSIQPVTSTPPAATSDQATTTVSPAETTSRGVSHSGTRGNSWWQSSAIIWVAAALGVLVLTLVIVSNLPDNQHVAGKQGSNTPDLENKEPGKKLQGGKKGELPKKTRPTSKEKNTGSTQTVVDDPKGDLLWASPTTGSAFKLTWVPPAGQMFILIRPASLVSGEQGQLSLTALGPTFDQYRAQWEKDAAVGLEDIDSMVLTLHDNGEAFPRPSFVVRTKAPRPLDQLLAAWGNPQETKAGDQVYFKGSTWCFFVPPDGDSKTFVMGAEEEIQEVAGSSNSIAPLRRELAELLKATDHDRHFTILFAPNFLFSNLFRDGRDLFFGNPAKLRKPLEWLIGEEVKAGLLSLHVGQHFYLEARLFGGLGKDKFSMARSLRERLAEIPQQIEEYFAVLNPPPYWRLVANRYPLMIRQLHRQTRIGVEQGHPMINIAMQPEAAHNLLLGGELCLSSTPGAAPVVATTKDTGPKTIDELLQRKFTVDIPQQDLEFAIKDIVDDVRGTFPALPFEFNIKVIGPELKLEGITRNQAVRDFAAKEKPLAEILTGIASKANPDPSVKDPSELAQKLIWVVADDPDKAGNRIILVTTRKDAAEEKYVLPKPFQPK
ncbi:MAG: protein kinase [Pirellulaceae bacterium]|nr:protein kinase [Pirellulaceae bacterium]